MVRQADGTTLSFPAWMTEIASADAKIVDEVHLSIIALLELRRLTTNALSSMHSYKNEGGHDEATNDTAEKPIRQSRPDSSPPASRGGKTHGNAPVDGVVASPSKDHRCGGEK